MKTKHLIYLSVLMTAIVAYIAVADKMKAIADAKASSTKEAA